MFMNIAIVGFGIIGEVHFEILKNLGLNVCAICDINPEKINCVTNIAFYTDYSEMLDKVKPDVVHICTPHYLHEDMIIKALNRNINVLCEKPMCITFEGIERILQAEKKSKAQLGICHQNRYNPENVFVKEYLKNKKVVYGHGTVLWHRDADYYASAQWRGKWNTEGGGVLINQALHTLDLMQWFLGFPQNVTAMIDNLTLKNHIEVEDTATIICSGQSGFSFFATNGGFCDFPVGIMIKTDKETINIFDNKVIIDDAVYNFEKDNIIYGKPCYGVGHLKLISDFYECINTGKKFCISGETASKVIKIIIAAYASSGEKRISNDT